MRRENFRKNIFLGPFTPTPSRGEAVDFTSSIGVMTQYTIVAPLGLQDNLLSILDPLSVEVWIGLLICIPVYITGMAVLNYIYTGYPNCEATMSFVLRTVLAEDKWQLSPKPIYQKILVLVWSGMMLVLISAYQGDLTSIITTPLMNAPFMNADGMVEQSQIKWGWSEGETLFPDYLKSYSPGTTLREMYEKSMTFPNTVTRVDDCYISAFQAKESGSVAAICDISSARAVVTKDFSKFGTCNFYVTHDRFLSSGNVLAIQVG